MHVHGPWPHSGLHQDRRPNSDRGPDRHRRRVPGRRQHPAPGRARTRIDHCCVHLGRGVARHGGRFWLLRRGGLRNRDRGHRAAGPQTAGGAFLPSQGASPRDRPTARRTSSVNNRSVAIVTDSTSDLPSQLARTRSITIVPLTLHFEGLSLLDGVDIRPSEFYRKLPNATTHPTTSQPAPGQFAEKYSELLANHDEVVSVHISEKLSGTYASAVQGAEMTDAKRVHVVDSQLVSMSLGLLTLAASELAAKGASADAVVERISAMRDQVQTYFSVATLEFLRRGGRIGRASALLGSVLQVKPVLCIRDGLVTPLERVRTFDRALNRVIDLAREVDRGKGLCVVVGHADAEEDAERVARELEPVAETLMIQPLGPVVGAHAGPGVVGVGCYPADLLPLGIKTAASARARA
ncbi:MAG: DegV family protein [Chloroflexi bacterium]|nr:MAG: DegV family protein [Chloroflexota bacterium]